MADSRLGELYERERSRIRCESKLIGPIGIDSWAGVVVSDCNRDWRHDRHRNFSGEQRHGARCRLRAAGVCSVDYRRDHRAVWGALLRRDGRSNSLKRWALRFLEPWAFPWLGMPFLVGG